MLFSGSPVLRFSGSSVQLEPEKSVVTKVAEAAEPKN
jgi:hypothetical protein